MTKLMEWLSGCLLILSVWISALITVEKHHFLKQYTFYIQIAPVLLLMIFGITSLGIIMYRVFTFNNCEQAAKELQEEIIEARRELKKKGMTF